MNGRSGVPMICPEKGEFNMEDRYRKAYSSADMLDEECKIEENGINVLGLTLAAISGAIAYAVARDIVIPAFYLVLAGG